VGENSNIFSYGTRQPKSHQIWPVGRAIFLHDVIRRRDRIEEFGTPGKSASAVGGLNAAADKAARRAGFSPTGPRNARPDDRLRRNPSSWADEWRITPSAQSALRAMDTVTGLKAWGVGSSAPCWGLTWYTLRMH